MSIDSVRSRFCVLVVFILFTCASKAQIFPQEQINKALKDRNEVSHDFSENKSSAFQSSNNSGVLNFLQNTPVKIHEINQLLNSGNTTALLDTIFVGDVPNDTLVINGTFFNNGPILVFNNGVLVFENANATILGDVYVFQNGKLFCDSSTLNFPQVYFYQRGIIAANNGLIEISNTILDYGGLSHTLAVVDNAQVTLTNINNVGFTTAGGYGNATITIDGSNQAGEFIMTDSANFSFTDANTILLWHHIPDNAIIDISFPNGTSVANYTFSDVSPGVNGIDYNVTVNNCTDIMWSLMPAAGSDVTVSNSTIRAIGLWFEGTDTIAVTGLVNNSTYTSFTAQLPDRNLTLNNSTLQTWSLYAFDFAVVTVTGSVVGEVGTLGKSFITSQGILCDGSGGYYWASDTTFNLAISTSVLGNIRSERNGICLLGYGSATAGASATGNSVMIVTQSSLPQDPVAYENGTAWLVHINPVQNAYVDSIVQISGSAWIDEGPLGSFMDFGQYTLEYKTSSAQIWNSITGQLTNEVHNSVLGSWDTDGLTPGVYQLRLNTRNDLGDSIDAVIQVTLLPSVIGLNENYNGNILDVFYDYQSGNININMRNIPANSAELELSDVLGRRIFITNLQWNNDELNVVIPAANFNTGVYALELRTGKNSYSKKLFISK